MPLHLVKLAVGINDVEHLRERQAARVAKGHPKHRTRMKPRRKSEILDGGSLYWVIRGAILVRQPIVGLHDALDSEGRSLCVIEMEPVHVLVQPTAKRPFQGWRYLPGDAAPPDLALLKDATVDPEMPMDMRRELSRLGLI
ncbi:MAG: DUF1489 domain-containing protein [Rhodospirillaceae bacterium]